MPLPMPIPSARARFNIPDLPSLDEILPFLRQIDENKWYSNFGPLICAFEAGFARAMEQAQGRAPQSLFALGTASGYSALVVGLHILGVGPGDQVLIPAINFPAGPQAVAHLGAKALLADADPETWMLTPAIAKAIARKTKLAAVMPVALYGIPLPADEWDAFTRETGVPVVIDAAAAIESQAYLKKGVVAHSLHALKPFGIGEGGLIVVQDPRLIDKARLYVNFGMQNRITVAPGENAKISEMHAAVALAQLGRWGAVKERRQKVYRMYRDALAPLADLFTPHPGLDQAVVSCMMLRLARPARAGLLDLLDQAGVCAHRTYFPPMYRHPHFQDLPLYNAAGRKLVKGGLREKAAHMQATEYLAKRVIGLPFHAFLEEADVRLAVGALSRLVLNN